MPDVLPRLDAGQDSLVRNAKSISSPWIYIGLKLLSAGMLLSLAELPYIPLFLIYLLLQDLAINYTRAKLAAGDLRYRTAYLALVFATVCFYTGLAVPLWHAPNVFSRSFATGLLLTIPLMGVLRGFRDRSFLVLTTALPVCTLTALALRDFFMLGDNLLLMSAGIPVVIGGVVLLRAVFGLHASDQKLHQANLEREVMLRELEASRARLEQVAALSGVAGWEMNLYERQCTLSPAAQALLDVKVSSFNLHGFAALFTERTAVPLADALADIEKQDDRLDVDIQLKSSGDEARWLRLTGEVLRENGEAVLFLGAMQDLSERIRLAEKERQEEVSGALSRLCTKAAAAFTQDLTDANQLLAGLGAQNASPSQTRQIDGLRRSLDRAFETATSLQAYAASKAIRPRVVDLNSSVAAVEQVFAVVLPSGIRFSSHADPRVIDAILDVSEIELALLHILFNARDALEQGGDITISTGIDDNGWRYVEVTDTGTGIPAAIRQKVLEPFFTTKRGNGARGLGLSVVRGIVEQGKGQLSIESAPGSGTRIRMSFPPPGEQEALVFRAELPDVVGTVLLVHESAEIFQQLSPVLLEAGLMLHHARSARDALEMVERPLHYEIILVDVTTARTLPGQVLQAKLPRLLPGAKMLLTRNEATDPSGELPDSLDLRAPATELLGKLLAALTPNPQIRGIPGA
jgi:signal transduction histidine kinase